MQKGTSFGSLYKLFGIRKNNSVVLRAPRFDTRKTAPAYEYRSSTSPSGIPIRKFLSVGFPLSLKESFEHYKHGRDVWQVQEELLERIKAQSTWRNLHIEAVKVPMLYNKEYFYDLDREEHYLSEICIRNYEGPTGASAEPADVKHVVITHGYGAGCGLFLKNLESLAKYLDRDSTKEKICVHAIDLPGCGISSRPKINFKTMDSAAKFEDWFCDSIERWRQLRGLNNKDKTLFVAHSLGAYLALAYNTKYPNTFRKLLCVSPAAIITPRNYTPVPSWFSYLWNKNISPFSLVRLSGPLGSFFTSGWSSRRFAKLTWADHKILHKYSYAIFNSRGSGEYFLNYVLKPGGLPRFPLVHNTSRVEKINCETSWLYGDEDWMDPQGGEQMSEYLNAKGLKSEVKIFSNSGHHLYLDNHAEFNEYVENEIRAL